MALPRQELVDALIASFDLNTFDRMLSDHLSVGRERRVAGIGMGLDAIVSRIVEIADDEDWAIDLIRGALAANPRADRLREFIARNSHYDPARHPPGRQNYFLSVFMRGGRVFYKRDEFRRNLQKIGTEGEPRVLAVDGGRYTGKTYSQDFLSFLREKQWVGSDQRIIYINMDDCVFEPEGLACIIGRRLDLAPETMPPDKGEQAPRRIPALMEWLIGGLEKSRVHVWWLILDGFRVQVHPSATHDFIRRMIDAVERDQTKVRMILLNYKEHLDLLADVILREEIEPLLEERDLPLFFRHVYTLSKKEFADQDIEQTVENVRRQVSDEVARRGPELRMQLLSLGLTRAAKGLLK